MKKRNSRRLFLVVLALMAAGALVVVTAVASVFAYRQFVQDDDSRVNLTLEGLQIEEEQATDEDGAVILWIEPGSPAEQAGLEPGMVILSVNGRSVSSPSELKEVIGEYEAGDTVTLSIEDGSETRDVAITLADAGPYLGVNVGPNSGGLRFYGRGFGDSPHRFALPQLPGDPQSPDDMPFRFHFDEFDFDEFGDEFDHFHLPFGVSALVMSVTEDSPAAEAGLQAGDQIVEANGETIESSQQLIDAVGALSPGDQITLRVERGDETLTVEVTLAGHPDDQERAYLGVFLTPNLMMHQEMEDLLHDQSSS